MESTSTSPVDGQPDEAIELSAAQGAGQRLDRFLADRLPQYSRSRLQRWIELGAVSSPGRALTAKTRLTGHETISVQPQPLAADHAFVPEPVPFDVCWENDALVVVNKHAGLVVHPGAGNWQGTLMNGLLHRYPQVSGLPRAGIVHRLDKNTSGLMVVALNEQVRQHLVAQLSERRVGRLYLALAFGRTTERFSCDQPIGRDPRHRVRMAVRRDGREALTDFVALQTGVIDDQAVTLLL